MDRRRDAIHCRFPWCWILESNLNVTDSHRPIFFRIFSSRGYAPNQNQTKRIEIGRKQINNKGSTHMLHAVLSLSLSLSSSIYLSVYLSIHLSFSVCLLFSGDFTVSVQQSWIFRLTKYACADNSIVKATDIHTSLSLSIYIYVYVSHGTYETQIHKTILCIYVYMSSALPFRISDKRMAKQRDDSRDN